MLFYDSFCIYPCNCYVQFRGKIKLSVSVYVLIQHMILCMEIKGLTIDDNIVGIYHWEHVFQWYVHFTLRSITKTNSTGLGDGT